MCSNFRAKFLKFSFFSDFCRIIMRLTSLRVVIARNETNEAAQKTAMLLN